MLFRSEEAKQFSVLHTLSLIELADKIQDKQTKQEAILFAEGMVSLVLGFTPAGPVVGCMEFLSGKDVFGNELSETQRYIALGASIGLHPKLLAAVKNLIGPISKKIFSAFSKENKLSSSYNKMIEVSHSAKKGQGLIAKGSLKNFSTIEKSIVGEADTILKSTEFSSIRAAHAAGQPVTVKIGGRTVQYEPVPVSGMTMFGEDGFIIGKEAFSSTTETHKTVLHELHRLFTSKSASGVSGELATSETRAAQEFADKAYEALIK